MANTLLDAIKQSQNASLNEVAASTAAGPASGTQALASTLAVGQTGKAAAPGAPASKMSNIQEKLGNLQTKFGTDALKTDVQTQQTQNEQDADVAKRADTIQNTQLEDKRQQVQKSYTQQVQSTLDNYRQQNRTLDLSKDKAKMEQIGFQLRLSNNEYIDNLKREGVKSRLDSQLKRKEAITQTVFADEQEFMQNNLQFQSMMNQKGRDLTTALSNIDLASALALASTQNTAANSQQMWTGIGNIAGAGVQAVGKASNSSSASGTFTANDQQKDFGAE